jgi:signal transduction histidine kinase/CheY-like chemotaxis protein
LPFAEAALTELEVGRRFANYGEILRALQALKKGNFSIRLATGRDGPDGEIAELLNEILEMNAALAAELERLREQVGNGQVQQRARLPGARGSWATCIDSINRLIDDLVRPGALSRKQQEDLQRTNEQLKEKANQLSEQMQQVEYKNKEIEASRAALEQKAEQLVLGSRYKSEFLANMSHELRTPLNSLLILAQLLAENAAGNLTPKQVEYAQTICISGNDLLALINDILDLSKIESGTVTLSISSESLFELRDYVERAFRQVAQDRGLAFGISMGESLPSRIATDMKRLRQILQNLLSNAFKFTLQGTVSLDVSLAEGGWTPGCGSLDEGQQVVAFSVADTGIGVAQDKQKIIFEAFRQADGTTSRQFEGTGLGLSISAELARLLGGEIKVQSSPGKGSTFTLYLPLVYQPAKDTAAVMAPESGQPLPQVRDELARRTPDSSASEALPSDQQDDREKIRPGDRVVLTVVEEAAFSAKLLHQVRELGFKGLRAANAHTALALANEYMPNIVTIDITNNSMSGWAILNLLKQDPDTRHIPVNLIAVDESGKNFACMCAVGIVNMPSGTGALREALHRVSRLIERRPASFVVAAGSKMQREDIAGVLAKDGTQVTSLGTGKQALKVLRKARIDCMIIGQSLSDIPGFMREVVQSDIGETYVILYTTVANNEGVAAAGIQALAEIFLLKRVRSFDAVLEETSRCLQQAMKEMPPGHRRPLPGRLAVPALAGRKVLLVDDDIRNIFALTGALEQQGMVVLNAESGLDGVEILEADADVDIVLMDIMMPEQDGYQTIRAIRQLEHFKAVPIIGVTAKAMKGDREKCIEAGATDYIAKPINVEQLLSLMRMWIADRDPAERL